MKIALCATHLFNMTLPQDRDYIGVDHGVEELLKQGITLRFAIGDFDSLQNRKSLEDLNIQILPEKKMLRIRMLLSNMQFLKVMMKLNYMVLPEDV